ncbi:GNAT family N-acetyltransferase [Hymenobacter sp. NST-14]|uniref:GNAT family N-acetyltransferase n=1 Tax=Hymenobacter piscis TaxID=2839984 RepID=UPI001C03121B|nr:GNAT family N-acetyltransferase [Hymenobacter piscis]MBT9395137.1 GNAT family N-acetyltransferase [Hymenobacter piscis]
MLALPAPAKGYVVRQQAGAAPALPPAYAPWLYLTPAHQARQTSAGQQLHFFLEEPAVGHTVAQLSVAWEVGEGVARSPWRAPFGAVQTAPALPQHVLRVFLQAVEAALAARGVCSLTLRPPAFAYEPAASARLTAVLTDLGYQIGPVELNSYLPLARDYEAHLHPSARRRLRKCQRQGLRFEQEPPLLLPLAYEFVRRCRQEKGQPLNITLEQLQDLFRALPRHFFLFSVRDAAGEWAAVSVAIQVRADVLYHFLPASPRAYNHLSPMVLINAGLHAFGRASGMRLLDLGISARPAGVDESLLRFKRHLGALSGLKLTFSKPLS